MLTPMDKGEDESLASRRRGLMSTLVGVWVLYLRTERWRSCPGSVARMFSMNLVMDCCPVYMVGESDEIGFPGEIQQHESSR